MNISTLFESKKTVYSLEIFPPKRNTSVDAVLNTLSGLQDIDCDFISVTYGAGGSENQREKTADIAALIKCTYHREPVAHLTCVGTGFAEIDAVLRRLKSYGIENILALRGDYSENISPCTDFAHASDLARYIKKFDPSFNLLGACYPQGHCESDSLAQDIENLKHKIDAGVSHLITQLFFDNNAFFSFMEKLRTAGIFIPVEAGIMPIMSLSQIERTVAMCGASIPPELASLVNRYSDDPDGLREAGIDYALRQIESLVGSGVDGIHVYTMNNVSVARRITEGCRPWLT